MAKRAKRANRMNPRQDRNYNTEHNVRRKNSSSNIIELNFPSKPKKSKVDIIPRNLSQEDLLMELNDENKHIVFAVGPAGSGKTLLATLHSIQALKRGQVEKIVITRPNVAVDDRDIGYLPGDILKKMTPWMLPILDVFSEYYSQTEIQTMLEENIIEMVPIAFVRGRTFKNSYIIFDEAQNSTPSSMLSVLTRIGEGSKLVVTGDIKQGDRGPNNGLSDFLRRYTNNKHIGLVQFKPSDIERHVVVKEVLEIYKDLNP